MRSASRASILALWRKHACSKVRVKQEPERVIQVLEAVHDGWTICLSCVVDKYVELATSDVGDALCRPLCYE